MRSKLYIPVYSLTLLLSAALIFSVQPMFSKMVLPLLGGTPQVWNTAMMVFQGLLLAGYAYAHLTSRFLNIHAQAMLHFLLLILFFFALPIAIPEGWRNPSEHNPALWQISLMVISVGGPFFVLAGSAPMLQRWFTVTSHPDASNPYFLYGASNLGSMSALIAYPVLIEPFMNLTQQSGLWSFGYIALIILTVFSALLIWPSKYKAQDRKKEHAPAPSWRLHGLWLILAFVPSSLMLGVTTFITTDIAAAPLFWVAPLALYVGTFIIAFARKPLIGKSHAAMIFGLLLIVMIIQMISWRNLDTAILILLHLSLFFFAALSCHMELTDRRPHPGHLTEFYMVMALGGVLGGIFNALIAPTWFVLPLEYALMLGIACFLRFSAQKYDRAARPYEWTAFLIAIALAVIIFYYPSGSLKKAAVAGLAFSVVVLLDRRILFASLMCICLLLFPPGHNWGHNLFNRVIHQDRNFFGVLRVVDTVIGLRLLMHGTTNHGSQALKDPYRLQPLSYYTSASPVGDVFDILGRQNGRQNIAVAGLGIGVMACFQKDGRRFDFFEINPQVVEIAENENYFTFLSDCGSPYEIIPGDARLTIADQTDQKYDAIFLDAFSSDNIPAHLLTIEAINLYRQKLKPDGLLVFHVSNNHLDIEPVLAAAAQQLDIPALARMAKGGTLKDSGLQYYPAHFVVLSDNKRDLAALEEKGWTPARRRKYVHAWSDQYSNIISVLGPKTSHSRMRDIEARKKRENAEKAL